MKPPLTELEIKFRLDPSRRDGLAAEPERFHTERIALGAIYFDSPRSPASLRRPGLTAAARGPALGATPQVELFAACHWHFMPEVIMSILPELEGLGIVWLECPVSETQDNNFALRAVRREVNERGMRLCGLEMAIGVELYEPAFAGGPYDPVKPDFKQAWGIA